MMRLLLVSVLVLGSGTLVFLGLLVMVRDLFGEGLLAAPSVTDDEAAREHTGRGEGRPRPGAGYAPS